MGRKVKYGHFQIIFGGESNGRSKYSDELVSKIKKDREENNLTYKELATKYSVNWQSVYGIIHRRIPSGIFTVDTEFGGENEDRNERR